MKVWFKKLFKKDVKRLTCGDCEYYTGADDWNLSCTQPHPTPKEKEVGLTYPFGHLCYHYYPACDLFKKKAD